jgi:cell wall-associated NlpC family hydrolase
MATTSPDRSRRRTSPLLVAAVVTMLGGGVALMMLVAVIASPSTSGCGASGTGTTAATTITLGPPGSGQRVGATEYGGPGDPSSGSVGSSGISLVAHPDSYAELGGTTFQTATAMGGLPYLTPLRITWGGHSAIAYKRDIGLGGGPIDGLPRVIDLWWQFAGALRIPYEHGLWSGSVRIERPPAVGAAGVLGAAEPVAEPVTESVAATAPPAAAAPAAGSACPASPGGGEDPVTSGPRAVLLPNGTAAAPAGAPAAVRGIIAAGNQIVGKSYVYGGGHGLPLNEVAPSYDCSSSVEHLLYGGGLLPVDYDAPSGTLESFGEPGVGRWVTIYASADHVFMYVAGLRWDTHNAAGPGDGSTGIGWHPLVRSSAGFVVRHPVGL